MIKIDRRLVANFDWAMLGIALVLSVAGITTIYSATRPILEAPHPDFYIKQMVWLGVGLVAMLAVVSFDYGWLRRFWLPMYGAGVVLLVAVLVMGRVGMGAKRWISIGPVGFQPSEVFKLLYIIALANYYSSIQGKLDLRGMGVAFFGFTLTPLLLIIKQPDLGTGIVVMVLFVGMTLFKGVRTRVLAATLTISLLAVPFIGSIVWDGLKDYQKKRIVVFFDPDIDPDGISYHITQSKVAIGSGQVFGKGYLQGTQGPFRFLPEKHTDFVFAVFAEERGFIGSLILLGVFMMLLLRGLLVAEKAKDEFARLLALGITGMFTMYCFVNIGMTLGLMPVVGIPLPFMSYGGTAIVSNYIAIGILINLRMRRFELFY